jgi:thermitase
MIDMKNFLTAVIFVSSSAFASQGWIVKLKPQAKSNLFISQKNVSQVREIPVSFGKFFKIEGQKASIEELRQHPDVEYIERNQVYTIDPVHQDKNNKEVNDASYKQQWGLKNTGRNSGGFFSPGKKGEDINAEGVWKLSRGANDIVVAVIDTGVDYGHKDLQANMWSNEAELNGQEGVDDDGNGYIDDIHGYDFANTDGDPMDGHSHGTHCAGVIGAVHNRAGIRGVMGNVKIMGIKFLTDSGSGTTEHAIQSIDYATKMGVDVMSNSWGGGEFSQALKEAIEKANEAGIIFVAAAGNSRRDNDTTKSYPANYQIDNVISVGAMSGTGKKASFSNYGKKSVHIFAPGKNILSTVKKNKYKKMSGTSMAAPFVSGAMGLLKASEPNITPGDARERLMATAVINGSLDKFTVSGRMDAFRLLKNQR